MGRGGGEGFRIPVQQQAPVVYEKKIIDVHLEMQRRRKPGHGLWSDRILRIHETPG